MSMSVCVFVSLSAMISPELHARSLPNFSCMLHMAVARSSSGMVTKSQEERAVLSVFFPIDNALCSIAFGTRTKTDEPFDVPFGMISGLGPRNIVLRGGDDPKGEGAILGKTCPTSLTPL